MRTNLSTEDIKNIISFIYNGNLAQYRATKGTPDEIPYVNENSENINLYDEQGIFLGEKDLAEHLNIHFYAWKNRLETPKPTDDGFDEWVSSLNISMNTALACVEVNNNSAVASQDIDAAKITGSITFCMQTNKVALLDTYATKLRNKYLGAPQELTNSFGDTIKTLIGLGIVLYSEEPAMTQLGSTVVVTSNFSVEFLSDAEYYTDVDISFSIGIDPDELEENPNGLKYEKLPLTKASFHSVCNYSACVHANRPDLSGAVNEDIVNSLTLQYFDFKQPLVEELNNIFWSRGAVKVSNDKGETWEDNILEDFNIPIFIKIKRKHLNGNITIFKYAYVITEMNKDVTNGEFNVNTLSLKTRSFDPAGYQLPPIE